VFLTDIITCDVKVNKTAYNKRNPTLCNISKKKKIYVLFTVQITCLSLR
jgi:hypothetical protein